MNLAVFPIPGNRNGSHALTSWSCIGAMIGGILNGPPPMPVRTRILIWFAGLSLVVVGLGVSAVRLANGLPGGGRRRGVCSERGIEP
jgi:hypothetical protein